MTTPPPPFRWITLATNMGEALSITPTPARSESVSLLPQKRPLAFSCTTMPPPSPPMKWLFSTVGLLQFDTWSADLTLSRTVLPRRVHVDRCWIQKAPWWPSATTLSVKSVAERSVHTIEHLCVLLTWLRANSPPQSSVTEIAKHRFPARVLSEKSGVACPLQSTAVPWHSEMLQLVTVAFASPDMATPCPEADEMKHASTNTEPSRTLIHPGGNAGSVGSFTTSAPACDACTIRRFSMRMLAARHSRVASVEVSTISTMAQLSRSGFGLIVTPSVRSTKGSLCVCTPPWRRISSPGCASRRASDSVS
mmetsp:Transcript_55925/g.127923  ORF Transcript_55925/g.127923 Transcript_55925/m.127923 type:complete len:308 (-) Transcript_55925:416-1339(-)